MANLASRVPKLSWPMIATLVRSIFEQADHDAAWAQLGDVVDKLTAAGFCDAALYVLDAADDILAFSAFPVEHGPRYVPTTPYLLTGQNGWPLGLLPEGPPTGRVPGPSSVLGMVFGRHRWLWQWSELGVLIG